MKRVELGALSGGGFGFRVSRPGFDVTDPNAPLIFDSDITPASILFKGAVPAEGTSRTVENFQLPGFPGTQTTTLRSWATFTFPEALPFVPFARIFKRYRTGDNTYYRDEFQQYGSVGCSNVDAYALLTERFPGTDGPAYQDVPTHYFLILGIPAR